MSDTKTTLYHSELVKMGPVKVTVKTDPLKSKFKKPGSGAGEYYIILIIGGVERQYAIENIACGDFFTGKKGKTFTMIAEGREAEATLTYVGESIADKSQPEPAQRQATPPAGKTHQPHGTGKVPENVPPLPSGVAPVNSGGRGNPVVHAMKQLNQIANGYRLTLRLADKIAEERAADQKPMTVDEVQAMRASLFIEGGKWGIYQHLPEGHMEIPGKQSK